MELDFFFGTTVPARGPSGPNPFLGTVNPQTKYIFRTFKSLLATLGTIKTLGLVQDLFGTLRTFPGPSKPFSNVRDLQNLLGTFTAFRDIQDLFGTFKDLLATLGTVQTFWALFWTFRTFLGPAKAF